MQQQIFTFMGRRIELWAHPDPDHMAMAIRTNRTFYELDVLMKCREVYLPGTAIIDVGANIGNHAVFFGAVLGAPVYAFEPYDANHRLLEMNIAANGLDRQVLTACCAIGASDGIASLQPGPANNLGITRVSFGAGSVPVRSLDSLAITGPIGLLKVDVEGAETAVLLGAVATISEWLPDIVVEAGHVQAFRVVAEILLGVGYVPHGRYAATATYLFRATDQDRRIRRILAAG
jgi:FkbM family methyltransferase